MYTDNNNKNIDTPLYENIDLSNANDYMIENYATRLLQSNHGDEINSHNRQITINKRETSYEGLLSKFENGEDGIYQIMSNDKNIIFTHKDIITDQDISDIPELSQLQSDIAQVKESFSKAVGKRRYQLKKQLIEMYQDQYIIRAAYKPKTIYARCSQKTPEVSLGERISIGADGQIRLNGIVDILNIEHISKILCNLSLIKEQAPPHSDLYYLSKEFDLYIQDALKDEPMWLTVCLDKIKGLTNEEISKDLQSTHSKTYTPEYISKLWRQKIPKVIRNHIENELLIYYYTYIEKGHWKKCSRCGEIKLAHPKFYSKNPSTKDGYYSICKDCRNGGRKGA